MVISAIGHFIQACPTNDDPNFDGRPRIKRTTGIPRSFLKTVDKPSAIANDGTVDDTKQPSGVMVNAEGEWVVAEPDQASWDQYQAKAKVSAAAQQAAALGSKELQEKGLECPIDNRLFVEPTKTPCCNTTYCNECITNALLESGLTCPSCSTEDIVLDHLLPDDETAFEIRSYQEENAPQEIIKDASKSPAPKPEPDSERAITVNSDSPSKDEFRNEHERKSLSPKSERSLPDKTITKAATPVLGPAAENNKKRPAETDLRNDRTPPRPAAATMAEQPSANGVNFHPSQKSEVAPSMPRNLQIPFSNGKYMMDQGINAITFPNMNGMNGFPGMQMNVGRHDPTMVGNNTFVNQSGNWNMWNQGYPQQHIGMTGPGYQNGMYATAGYNQQNIHMPMSNGYTGMNGMGPNGYSRGSFPNQQRNHFHGSSDEDSAYFRKPVNPHRHQARRTINRPTDYREI